VLVHCRGDVIANHRNSAAEGWGGEVTSAANLAAVFAQQGRRVLAVDCDPQGSLALAPGADPTEIEATPADTLLLSACNWEGVGALPLPANLAMRRRG
jgi:cellulose biosynthesis protein BcsQ